MLLELVGLIPLSFLVKSSLKSVGNAPGFPGSILQVPCLNPCSEAMENIPGAPWANSFKFSFINPHWNQWKILLELLGSIPSSSIMESLLEINGKYSKRFLGYFLSKSFSKVNSTCSCTFLTQFLRVPLSTRIRNLHKMLLELPGPIPLHFFIKSVLKSMVNALGAC